LSCCRPVTPHGYFAAGDRDVGIRPYSELGGLNKFVHTWVYKDLNERARVREDARTSGGAWPPQAGVRPIRQENKLLVPAAFSPVR
jgi:hypothetical protein